MLESTTPLDTGYGTAPELPPEGAANLRKAAKWGRFLGIVSMVIIGLFILFLLFFSGTFLTMSGLDGLGPGSGMVTFIFVFYGLIFLFGLYISYLLYDFGAKALTGVDTGDSLAVTQSLGSLARMFKIYGILTIIYLGFMALSVITLIATGASSFL